MLWAGLAPGLYFGALALVHALPDALEQLLSPRGALFAVAVKHWLTSLTFLGGGDRRCNCNAVRP